MIIQNISFIVNHLWIVHYVKEIKHVQSPYLVKIIFNVMRKLMHQRISLWNTLAHKVKAFSSSKKIYSNAFLLVHTMCSNNMPLRNTLYGYIVSPGYPYPMADNLKCSLSIGRDLWSKMKKTMFFLLCRSGSNNVYWIIDDSSSITRSDYMSIRIFRNIRLWFFGSSKY